jgi:hypothetical protein
VKLQAQNELQETRLMAHQIFLIGLHEAVQHEDAVREELADMVSRIGGFILMAAGAGGLITAFDEQWQPLFKQHKAVETCGALSLDPNGAAANKLRHLFAANVAAQLASRASAGSDALAEADEPPSLPRHRPLVWHRPAPSHPLESSGVRISTHTNARGTP